MKEVPIGQYLVDRGVVSREEVENALETQKKTTDRYLGEILVERGAVAEHDFIPPLSEHLGIDHTRLIGKKIDQSVIDKVPVRYAHFYRVMPVELTNGTLTLAMTDPQNVRKIDDVRLVR